MYNRQLPHVRHGHHNHLGHGGHGGCGEHGGHGEQDRTGEDKVKLNCRKLQNDSKNVSPRVRKRPFYVLKWPVPHSSSARNENVRPLLDKNIPLISGKYGLRNHC